MVRDFDDKRVKEIFSEINDAQVYFIQRWLEQLNRNTIDTYKYKYSNSHILLIELKYLISDVENDNIYRRNLTCCVDELLNSLDSDLIIREHYSNIRSLISQISINSKEDRPITALEDTVNNVLKTIFDDNYYNWIISDIEKAFAENSIKTLEKLLVAFITELINLGWDRKSLESLCFFIFIEQKDSNIFNERWNLFLDKLNQEASDYMYYFQLKEFEDEIFQINSSNGINISYLTGEDIIKNHKCSPKRIGIVNKKQKYIGLRIKEKQANFFNAIKKVEQALCEIEAQFYYLNVKCKILRQCNIIIDENNLASKYDKFIRPSDWFSINRQFKDIDKTNYSEFLNRKDSENNQKIINVINQYGLFCVCTRSETRLISIWTALESLMVTNHFDGIYDHIRLYLPPILCMGYIYKIVKNLYMDFLRCRVTLHGISFVDTPTKDDLIAFAQYVVNDATRALAFSACQDNQILKKRLGEVCTLLSDRKRLELALIKHNKKIEWHIQRIYNIRNALTHNAYTPLPLEQLIDNLDYYLMSVLDDAIKALTTGKFTSVGEYYLFTQRKYEQIKHGLSKGSIHFRDLINDYF